jgi:hypothetical protein
MNKSLLFLAGLLATLFVSESCKAQQSMWATWETTAIPRRGPESAAGLLVYFHDRFVNFTGKEGLPEIFIDLAEAAQWDVLRINRHLSIDDTSDDDQVLAFTAEQIERAHQDGYKRIIICGGGRGGWLALLASTLNNVDGVLGLGPTTVSFSRERLEWQRDALARWLSRAKARRIAIFFFRDDQRESVDRAETTRQALGSNGATFMLIDRAPSTRVNFTQRYRDCVLRLLRDNRLVPGERSCNLSDRALF